MKRVGKLCLCLAGGLVLNASLRAAGTQSPGNPYAPIVVRNIFDIHPLPPVDPSKQDNKPPPPKITLNGIISVLGHTQALYKVAMPARPGIPPRDQTYMLGEGEAQDEIEVTKIDGKAGLVTFNNHGMEQEILLANATASSGPPPAPAGPAPGSVPRPGSFRPGFPPGGGNASGGGVIRFGQPGGLGAQNPSVNGGNNANNNGANPSSRLGVAMGGAGGFSGQPSSQQTQAPLSADEQATMITYNHAMAVAKGDPTAVIFPPTEYDSEAGVPSNIAPPPTPGGTPSP